MLGGSRGIREFGFDYKVVYLCLTGKQKTHKGHSFSDTGRKVLRKNSVKKTKKSALALSRYKKLPELLKWLRISFDYRQQDIAEHIGKCKGYVSDLESGKRNITLAILEQYSLALGMPVSSILELLEENRSNEQKSLVKDVRRRYRKDVYL